MSKVHTLKYGVHHLLHACHFLPSVPVSLFCVHHKVPCSTSPRFQLYPVWMYEQYNTFGTLVGVGAACRDAKQVIRSAGLRCGNKQTYRFSVREPRRSGLRTLVITHFDIVLLTFHCWFRQTGMRPRTVLLLRRSLSAQSLRLMAVAYCGLALSDSLSASHTHTHTHPWEADSSLFSQEISGVLWKAKFHYLIHNSEWLVPGLCKLRCHEPKTVIFPNTTTPHSHIL